MMSASAPVFGRYVKHIDSRLIIEWICYDPESELLLIRWPGGSFSMVHRRGVVSISANEETEFLRLRKTVFV
jgi:hypothetical protein